MSNTVFTRCSRMPRTNLIGLPIEQLLFSILQSSSLKIKREGLDNYTQHSLSAIAGKHGQTIGKHLPKDCQRNLYQVQNILALILVELIHHAVERI